MALRLYFKHSKSLEEILEIISLGGLQALVGHDTLGLLHALIVLILFLLALVLRLLRHGLAGFDQGNGSRRRGFGLTAGLLVSELLVLL